MLFCGRCSLIQGARLGNFDGNFGSLYFVCDAALGRHGKQGSIAIKSSLPHVDEELTLTIDVDVGINRWDGRERDTEERS